MAYLAGIIDGEGYIGIAKTTRRDMVSPSYKEKVSIRMVSSDAVTLLAETFEGTVWREKPHANNGRPMWAWEATRQRARRVLIALLPWLRVKRANAETVLELDALRRVKRTRLVGTKNFPDRFGKDRAVSVYALPEDNLSKRDALYQRCKALNRPTYGVPE